MMANIDRLSKVCEEALEAVGYELVDLEYLRDPSGWVLRVFIDHQSTQSSGEQVETEQDMPVAEPPRSGITHQDCKKASRHLGTVLDVEEIIDSAYRLEISSPGVKRPLRKEKDFRRFAGHRAKVEMFMAQNGQKKYTGVIRGAGEGKLLLKVKSEEVELPLAQMKKARLEVEL